MASPALRGLGVLITRPSGQADELADAISAAGGDAIRFPAIEIESLPAADVARSAESLPTPDFTIFVSRNAVEHGLPFAEESVRVAIGPATAATLADRGKPADIVPSSGYDSESLLQEAGLQAIENKRVRIVRGTDGREHLGQQLTARGAHVDYLATYRRQTAAPSAAALEMLEDRWRNDTINVVTVFSVATLDSLLTLLPDSCRPYLRKTPLVTPAARVIKDVLKRFPGARTGLAAGTDTESIVRAVARAAALAR